jgi:hypothetical protein
VVHRINFKVAAVARGSENDFRAVGRKRRAEIISRIVRQTSRVETKAIFTCAAAIAGSAKSNAIVRMIKNLLRIFCCNFIFISLISSAICRLS